MSGSRVLGIVPARGGSKGVPRKNLRPLAGQSLIAYAAAAARASGVVDRAVLSTDDEEIRDEGLRCGLEAPFLRPPGLAADDTPMLAVIEHAVGTIVETGWQPDAIVLLQPTSPLRQPAHIRRAIELLRETGADSVVTVVELPRHHSPDYVMRIDDGKLVNFLPDGVHVTRRQDARPAYVRDGTVYACTVASLLETRTLYGRDCRPLILPAEESLSIDTPDDWAEAERRLLAAPGMSRRGA
jgi:CMP-N-acetylneuraminic acid synthetase